MNKSSYPHPSRKQNGSTIDIKNFRLGNFLVDKIKLLSSGANYLQTAAVRCLVQSLATVLTIVTTYRLRFDHRCLWYGGEYGGYGRLRPYRHSLNRLRFFLT